MSIASLFHSKTPRRLAWAAVALLLWGQLAALTHEHHAEPAAQHGMCVVCSVATAAAPPPERIALPGRGLDVGLAPVVAVIDDFRPARLVSAHTARAPPVSIPRSA